MEYRKARTSHAQPGYTLSRQTPPISVACSSMTKDRWPARASSIPAMMPPNPAPMIPTSWSGRGTASIAALASRFIVPMLRVSDTSSLSDDSERTREVVVQPATIERDEDVAYRTASAIEEPWQSKRNLQRPQRCTRHMGYTCHCEMR